MRVHRAARLLPLVLASVVAIVLGACAPKPVAESAAADSTRVADSLALLAKLEVGQRTYLAYCAMCHGNTGNGDGTVAAAMQAKGVAVARLNDGERMNALTRDDLAKVIARGGAHTGRSNLMPAWGELLGPELIDALAAYVATLSAEHPAIPANTLREYLAAPAGTPEKGRELFVHHCVACHGDRGRGDGPTGERLWADHQVRPRDLTDGAYLATRSDAELYAVVSRGGGHFKKSNFMPSWTVTLSPDQIRDLVAYVRAVSGTAAKP
jgi:cbb3-type cytochrome c oxidase subunit III